MRKIIGGALVLSVLGLSAPASRLWAQDIGLEIGSAAPVVKLHTLDGKVADLGEYVGKKPVLLEFWATWCGNCQELEPSMKVLHEKYGKQVAFVGVAVSVNQSPARISAYVDKHKLPWTQLFDTKGEASGAYDAPATSYIVVLDGAGKVVYTGLGGKQDLEPALKKAIGG
jgi:thiol-disulfide isomerase/thioredoxin